MVEIETLPDDPPAESSKPDADGWISLMGEDLVLKIVDKSPPASGKEPEPINPQDAVLVDVVGRLADDKGVEDGPKVLEAQSWLSSSGKTGNVWSHSKYALGLGTRSYQEGSEKKQVPPNSNMMFEITVKMIVMDTSRLNPYFTIQKAATRKSIANDIYQYEWCPKPKDIETDPSCDMAMSRAIRLYTKAAKEMEDLLNGTYFAQVERDHPQRAQTKQLLLDCLNNIVAVQLKQEEYHQAKESAVQVLKVDGKNLKALLRAAKAALLDPASTMEEVEAALKVAESEITYKQPQEEKQLKQLKQQFKKRQQQYKEQTKAMFANKLQSKPKSSAPKETTTDVPETTPSSDPTPTDSPTSDDNATFWKTQAMTMILQIFLPLGLYLLYRIYLATQQDTPLEDALDNSAQEVEDILDLDET